MKNKQRQNSNVVDNRRLHALRPLTLVVFLSLYATSTWAEEYFDPAFISGNEDSQLDLSFYSKNGDISPGDYLVSISVNEKVMPEKMIKFVLNKEYKLVPVFTPNELQALGVDVENVPALKLLPKETPIEDITALIPDYRATFTASNLALKLSFPQLIMKNKSESEVDPTLWNEGIPALLFNYSLMGSASHTPEANMKNILTQMFGGVNFQAWRFRFNYFGNYTKYDGHGTANTHTKNDFNNVRLYRDIKSLKSTLQLGEIMPVLSIFESFPFKGVSLSSNEEMIPQSQRGFAPVITGYANSNALVLVKQNGNTVYQTYVSPGPFRIDDLRQTQLSGELEVFIQEADGSVRKQMIASSSLPIMEREGAFKYEVSAGQYNAAGTAKSKFALGSFSYGLPRNITLYGGGMGGSDYLSSVVGIGTSLGKLGALSFDATMSRAKIQGADSWENGQSYRVRYAKNMLSTGTTVDLAAYRYSTKEYYSFSDMNLISGNVLHPWGRAKRKNNFQISLSQQLGRYGSLTLSGNREDYWDSNEVNKRVSLSYNATLKEISYFITYNIEKRKDEHNNWPEDRRLSVGVQIPFKIFSPTSLAEKSSLSYAINTGNHGNTAHNVGLRTSLLNDKLGISVDQDYSKDKHANNNSNLNINYVGEVSNSTLGYSYSNDYNTLSGSFNGGIIAHPYGVTLARYVGSSPMALVEAEQAAGTKVNSGMGTINNSGFALIPIGNTYNKNPVALDIYSLPNNVEVDNSIHQLYPTKDAVVYTKFNTKVGHQVIMTLMHQHKPLPFGALVSVVGDKENMSVVGDNGEVYLAGLLPQGQLTVQWGNEAQQRCQVNYTLPIDNTTPQDKIAPVIEYAADCQ
ncbi:MAG: fimbria/pilus outer membrane usher protein [Pseudomonadota bacterium]|uniref:fimbria/pilus outer membrane usher protein n=1 Tax=Providencia TaxID=586 RepID=UPI0024B11E32